MVEAAISAMRAAPEQSVWTLEELRLAAGVALRTRYRLSHQLMSEHRVIYLGGGCFAYRQNEDLTMKTYGEWIPGGKVTETEYRLALEIVRRDVGGPMLEGAYQTVRYCNDQIYIRDHLIEFLGAIRAAARN